MFNRVCGTLLFDNDPILGDALYQLLRSLNSGLYFVAVAKPEAMGIVERCGLTLKTILDLSDRDPESVFRVSDISPAIQFVLSHAARNSVPQNILGNLTPNSIETMSFEQPAVWSEHTRVEESPNDFIAEKQVMMNYITNMKQNFAVKQKQAKLEEQLAGRRMKPKTGFKVHSWVEVKDKNGKWFEARIAGVTPTGY